MRMSTLALAVSAVAAIGWSGVGVASAAPPKCADLGGVVDANQICQISASDPGYSMKISYPVDYPEAQAVFDYVKQTRDGFLNVAEMPDGRLMPYELDTTETEFNSDIPPRGTQSVVFETYQGLGGAHPSTFYKAFNWDQGLSKPITIDNLFREGTAPFPIIFSVGAGRGRQATGAAGGDRAGGRSQPDDVSELCDHQRSAHLLLQPGRRAARSRRGTAGRDSTRSRRRHDRPEIRQARNRRPDRRW